MNIAKFKEKYMGAPIDERELAETIVEELDPRHPLYKKAERYLVALEQFDLELLDLEWEWG
jgi:hypothetical protein